jgi:hypothetical protein
MDGLFFKPHELTARVRKERLSIPLLFKDFEGKLPGAQIFKMEC